MSPPEKNVPLRLPERGFERGRAWNGRVPLIINEGSEMKNTIERPRRVFRLQRRIPYMGTKPGPAREIFSLSVPRDVVLSMGLAKGDRSIIDGRDFDSKTITYNAFTTITYIALVLDGNS